MKTHKLKVNKEFFEKILTGDKNFEIRLGDSQYSAGDELTLLEKNPDDGSLTGRSVKKVISYTRNTKDIKHWAEEDIQKYGLTIIAFKDPQV